MKIEEIKSHFDVTDEQAERFARQVERREQLQHFFDTYPEEQKRFQEQLERAAKALNYKQPYRIAVIGTTGAGKSTLINAMLGRDLVLMKDIGKPATGTALQIFLDLKEGKEETASVEYRDEANIRQLIDQFIERYQLDGSESTDKLDISLARAISNWKPKLELNEQASKEFEDLRSILADLVRQYANNQGKKLNTEFSLTSDKDVQELMKLSDENSDLNNEDSPFRRIGLVKSVTYHIKPQKNANPLPTLQLPKNVCLVDLPGLDGTTLHDIIITEGIKDADAVIFILRPPRILSGRDNYLLRRVRKYISLEGSVQSGERIFIVLNAKDSIMVDSERKPEQVEKDMKELLDLLIPGYGTDSNLAKRGGDRPYFLTSAWAAYTAQKKLKGEQIENETYDATKVKLNAKNKNDEEVLEVSQVPKLVEELTKFARERLIEGQIREGRLALNSIINTLSDEYEVQKLQLTENGGESYLQDKAEKELKTARKKLEKLVIDFRKTQDEHFDNWGRQLQDIAHQICDDIDQRLLEKIPKLWQENYTSGIDRLAHQEIGQVKLEPMLTEAQIYLWQQLTYRVPSLASHLVDVYTAEIETYQMAQKISNGCYDCVAVNELAEKIKTWINNNMKQKMKNVAERLPLTKMTAPNHYFTALRPEHKHEKQTFLDICEEIPKQEQVNSHDIEPLIAEIRQQYEDFIQVDCVEGMLNLYRYEMIFIENCLLKEIANIFSCIRKDDDPVLKARIDQSISDPALEQLKFLEQKQKALSPLKEAKS